MPGLQLGVDGYYKNAKNQLDDGLFGASLIPSNFNYREGRVYGVEFTGTYTRAVLRLCERRGRRRRARRSAPGSSCLARMTWITFRINWVYLDHDQRVTGSFGVSYTLKEGRINTRVYVDALYGSGLTHATRAGVPNGGSRPALLLVNLGAEQTFNVGKKQFLKARLDVVNVTDNVYELRDGSGIGVNAAQYGMRLGFFGSVSYVF